MRPRLNAELIARALLTLGALLGLACASGLVHAHTGQVETFALSRAILWGTFAVLCVSCIYSSIRYRPRSIAGAIAFLAALVICLFMASQAFAQIPQNAHKHRVTLQLEARRAFGLSAPIARFAGQIHQESGWRPDARSKYADGLAQFTPGTAAWIAEAYAADCAPANPFSERWAIRCMVRYDRHLFDRIRPMRAAELDACDRWAFVLSGYNGGPGWVSRDRRLAASVGLDPDRWAGNVATVSTRAQWAFVENRGYPRRILGELEPRYIAAGWPSDGNDCSGAGG